jgi:hypothetical protein
VGIAVVMDAVGGVLDDGDGDVAIPAGRSAPPAQAANTGTKNSVRKGFTRDRLQEHDSTRLALPVGALGALDDRGVQ